MSQLLVRLRQQLSESSDPVMRAELIARIAAYQARTGKFADASAAIAQLRESYGDGRSGRATVWIMLAEALIHLFGKLSKVAMERVRGAQALAVAMRYEQGIACTSAWKAHIEFETSDFIAMARSLKLVFQSLRPGDDDSLARASAVLSNAFMIAGERRFAQEWFKRGHEAAVRNGDQASIEALVYNRTTFGLAQHRVERCAQSAASFDIGIVRREVESVKTLQLLLKAGALTNHIHLWSARLSILEGNYDAAIAALSAVRSEAPFADYNFNQMLVDLEICYCRVSTGEIDAALDLYSSISFDFVERLDLDEQVVVAWLRTELAGRDSRFGDSADLFRMYTELSDALQVNRSRLLASLHDWVPQ